MRVISHTRRYVRAAAFVRRIAARMAFREKHITSRRVWPGLRAVLSIHKPIQERLDPCQDEIAVHQGFKKKSIHWMTFAIQGHQAPQQQHVTHEPPRQSCRPSPPRCDAQNADNAHHKSVQELYSARRSYEDRNGFPADYSIALYVQQV